MWTLLILSLLFGSSLQQLHIQVFKQDYSNSSGEILASYTHPRGVSMDWWKTSYINIPLNGLQGILLYKPFLCLRRNRLPKVPGCSGNNLSLILLTPKFLSCPERIVKYAQKNGYSGVITYDGDSSITIDSRVYDFSTKSVVDLKSTGIFFATVSEEFANVLNRVAVSSCNHGSYNLTKVSRGGANVMGVRFGISTLVGGGIIFGLIIISGCLSLTRKYCESKFPRFCDVQDEQHNQEPERSVHTPVQESSAQMLELESFIPSEAQENSVQSLYMPEIKTFDGSGEDGTSSTCTICLDCFSHGEDVCVLDCKGGHTFHPPCIRKWLMSQNTCPVCRTQLLANL